MVTGTVFAGAAAFPPNEKAPAGAAGADTTGAAVPPKENADDVVAAGAAEPPNANDPI